MRVAFWKHMATDCLDLKNKGGVVPPPPAFGMSKTDYQKVKARDEAKKKDPLARQNLLLG